MCRLKSETKAFNTVIIGNDRVDYGYNAHGDYVPTAVGKDKIGYGYNAHGDYTPDSIGKRKIDYGYNARGDYVPTSLKGGRNIKGKNF